MLELASRGYSVSAVSRSGNCDGLSAAAAFDLRDEASIEAAAARLSAEDPFEMVIVATGLLHSEGTSPEKTYRDLRPSILADYFAVNAIGPALVAKHFVPLMPKRGRAVFAALSARVGSISDNRLGGWYGYRASKAALNMLIRTLSIEVARTRPEALCVTIHPGTVDTRLSEPFQKNVAKTSLFTPEFSAMKIIDVLETLPVSSTGGCFDWSGTAIAP